MDRFYPWRAQTDAYQNPCLGQGSGRTRSGGNSAHIHDQRRDPAGFSLGITALLSENLGIPVIASGGAGTEEHFVDAFTTGKADAALAASIFHFGTIPIPRLKKYLSEKGVAIRL
jgi:imidazole glycerol phosphate synthase subunit HisF